MFVAAVSSQAEHLFLPECEARGALHHGLGILGAGGQQQLLRGERGEAFGTTPMAHPGQPWQATEAHPEGKMVKFPSLQVFTYSVSPRRFFW